MRRQPVTYSAESNLKNTAGAGAVYPDTQKTFGSPLCDTRLYEGYYTTALFRVPKFTTITNYVQ